MTDKVNSAGDIIWYDSPQVKVVSVKSRRLLCGSPFGEPGLNDYGNGSDSYFGFGDDDE